MQVSFENAHLPTEQLLIFDEFLFLNKSPDYLNFVLNIFTKDLFLYLFIILTGFGIIFGSYRPHTDPNERLQKNLYFKK